MGSIIFHTFFLGCTIYFLFIKIILVEYHIWRYKKVINEMKRISDLIFILDECKFKSPQIDRERKFKFFELRKLSIDFNNLSKSIKEIKSNTEKIKDLFMDIPEIRDIVLVERRDKKIKELISFF